MSTVRVNLSADVYMVCLSHALSTEKEEVMGLLIGEIDETKVAHISAVILLRRSDKRKDRVEISPEQLSDASTQAEVCVCVCVCVYLVCTALSCNSVPYDYNHCFAAFQTLAINLRKPMRVLGWYHSHPHITVWPSHVDVQTQAIYQMMDEGFVGLIFSVFSEDATSKLNQVQITCFQSVNQASNGEPQRYVRMEIPPAHSAQHIHQPSLPRCPGSAARDPLPGGAGHVQHDQAGSGFRPSHQNAQQLCLRQGSVQHCGICERSTAPEPGEPVAAEPRQDRAHAYREGRTPAKDCGGRGMCICTGFHQEHCPGCGHEPVMCARSVHTPGTNES
ncbi:hypothetical protein MTO96_028450 [Rhipicephalus appendiculatus]